MTIRTIWLILQVPCLGSVVVEHIIWLFLQIGVPFCGFPYNKSPNNWGRYWGP